MSGLFSRVSKLEQRPQAQDDATRTREQVAEYFADAIYAPHRDAIVAALMSDQTTYEFEVSDGDQRSQGRYVVTWWGREQGLDPVVIHFTKDWRGVGG